jgi:hypothetical protein
MGRTRLRRRRVKVVEHPGPNATTTVISGSQLIEVPVYVFQIEDAISQVYEYTMAGMRLGHSLSEIQKTLAVELAIQSGELALPWSEEELENDLWDGGPHYRDTYKRLCENPKFATLAYGWAYHKCHHMFYMLDSYRTDGLK